MRTHVVPALWIVVLCIACLNALAAAPVVKIQPFGDQPQWKIDAPNSSAIYLPDKNSLATPTIILNSAVLANSSITISIESDAKVLRLNGQNTMELNMSASKQHTLFLSFKGTDSTIYFDGREPARKNGLWIALVASNVDQIPIALSGATYATIRYQTGTDAPPVAVAAAPVPIAPVVVVPAPAPTAFPVPVVGNGIAVAPAVASPPLVMQGNGSLQPDGAIALSNGQRITSVDSFTTPVSFQITAKTDSTNIRISYAATQIIFNWELDPTQLRIDGGPANGMHKKGAGQIPVNQWVVIDLTVTPDTMVIGVNGQERYRVNANFSQICQPLSIFQANGSNIEVSSVVAQSGNPCVTQNATFVPLTQGVTLQQVQQAYIVTPQAGDRARLLQEAAERFREQQLAAAQARLQVASPLLQQQRVLAEAQRQQAIAQLQQRQLEEQARLQQEVQERFRAAAGFR